MNREEAINELIHLEWYGRPFDNTPEEVNKADRKIKALGMAIEALSTEPCEDAISRAEAIRIASGYCHWTNIPDELAKLPSVTPKQKMGRWIDEGFYAEGHSEHAYRCSECDEHYIGYVGEFKYCPNCGAKKGE